MWSCEVIKGILIIAKVVGIYMHECDLDAILLYYSQLIRIGFVYSYSLSSRYSYIHNRL